MLHSSAASGFPLSVQNTAHDPMVRLQERSHALRPEGLTSKDIKATTIPRSLLQQKPAGLLGGKRHGSPRYTVSQDCSDNRKVQSLRLCALDHGRPRLLAKRLRESEDDDYGLELDSKRVKRQFFGIETSPGKSKAQHIADDTLRSRYVDLKDSLGGSILTQKVPSPPKDIDLSTPYVCPRCYKEYLSFPRHHERFCLHSRPYKCVVETCKYHKRGFLAARDLERHVNDKHSAPPRNFICGFPQCAYGSTREENCKRHMENSHDWGEMIPQ